MTDKEKIAALEAQLAASQKESEEKESIISQQNGVIDNLKAVEEAIDTKIYKHGKKMFKLVAKSIILASPFTDEKSGKIVTAGVPVTSELLDKYPALVKQLIENESSAFEAIK